MRTTQPLLDRLDAVPRIRDGVDLSRLSLTPQDAFVLSRVDGRATVREIVLLTGLGEAATRAALLRLAEAGLLRVDGDPAGGVQASPDRLAGGGGSPPLAPAPSAREAPGTRTGPSGEVPAALAGWESFPVPPSLLAEETDLTEERRRQIIFFHGRLDGLDHYQVLGVRRDASADDIRRAYYSLTRLFHPDRYFRKELGSYRGKLHAIFRRIGRAYEVLADPALRARYDEALSGRQGRAGAVAAATPRSGAIEAATARPSHTRTPTGVPEAPSGVDPEAQRAFLEGCRKLDAGQVVPAHKDLLAAVTLDPGNREYRRLFEKVNGIVRRAQADAALRKAMAEEKAGRLAQAATLAVQAAEAFPTPESLGLAADLLERLGKDPERALEYARRAVAAAPEDRQALRRLARLLAAAGHHGEAEAVQERLDRLSFGVSGATSGEVEAAAVDDGASEQRGRGTR